MKNLWIQTEDAFVTWIADFTAIATHPAAILEFARALLAAGAVHHVFDVAEAPLIGYRRDRDGALGDVLSRLLEHDRVLDLFGFTGAAMLPGLPRSSTVETTVSHYDRFDRERRSAWRQARRTAQISIRLDASPSNSHCAAWIPSATKRDVWYVQQEFTPSLGGGVHPDVSTTRPAQVDARLTSRSSSPT
jgi:hypothetical protein